MYPGLENTDLFLGIWSPLDFNNNDAIFTDILRREFYSFTEQARERHRSFIPSKAFVD